jgi:hypothetical protein
LPLPLPFVPFLPSLPLSWLLAAVLRATLAVDLLATRFVVRVAVFFAVDVVDVVDVVDEARFTGFFVPFGGLGLVVFLAAVLRTGRSVGVATVLRRVVRVVVVAVVGVSVVDVAVVRRDERVVVVIITSF